VDSLIVSMPEEVVLAKKGGKTKVRRLGGAGSSSSLASVELDSVVIQSVSDGERDQAAWVATSTAGWLAVNNSNGNGPGALRFQRTFGSLASGVHVDSIIVALAAESQVRAFYVDTVEVVDVPSDRKSTRLNSSHVKISYAVF